MVLAIVGAFGHSVFSGLRLAMFGMLPEDGRTQYTEALDRTFDSPVMLFAALGLLGSVVGTLLLAAGMWRSRAVSRWIPAALGAYIALEFAASALSQWATFAAVGCFAAALTGLTIAVLQRGRADQAA